MAVQARGPRDNLYVSSSEDSRPGMSLLGVANFTKWKQAAVERLINNEDLLKLLYYDSPDALSKAPLTEEQISEIVSPGENQQIFQYRYVSNLAKRKTSYLSMDLSYFKPLEEFRLFSEKYVSGYLYIYILSDIGIMEVNQGIRADLILSEVYRSLDGLDSVIGMGKLGIETQLPLWVDNNAFGGYSVGFKVSDLK